MKYKSFEVAANSRGELSVVAASSYARRLKRKISPMRLKMER